MLRISIFLTEKQGFRSSTNSDKPAIDGQAENKKSHAKATQYDLPDLRGKQSRKENLQFIRTRKISIYLVCSGGSKLKLTFIFNSMFNVGRSMSDVHLFPVSSIPAKDGISLRGVGFTSRRPLRYNKHPVLNPYHFILERRIGLYLLTNLHEGLGKDLLPSQTYDHVIDIRLVVNIIERRT